MKENNKYQIASRFSHLTAEGTLVNIVPDKIDEIPQVKIEDIFRDVHDFAYKRWQGAISVPAWHYNDYSGLLTRKEHELYKKYSQIYWSKENKRVYTCIHNIMKSTKAAMRMRFKLNELDKKFNIQKLGGMRIKSLYGAIINKLMLYETEYYLIEYKLQNQTLYNQYAELFNLLMEDYVRIAELNYNEISTRVIDPRFAFRFLYSYYRKCKFNGPKISANYMQTVCANIDDDKTLENFYELENKLYAKKLIYKVYIKQLEYKIDLDLKDELANFKMNPDKLSVVLSNYEKYKADEKLYPKFIMAISEYIDNEVYFNKKRDRIGEIYSEISEQIDMEAINEINDRLSEKTRYYLLKYMCKY